MAGQQHDEQYEREEAPYRLSRYAKASPVAAGADRLRQLVAYQVLRQLEAAKRAEELRAKRVDEAQKWGRLDIDRGQLGVNEREVGVREGTAAQQLAEWNWKLAHPEQLIERDVIDPATNQPGLLAMEKFGGGNRRFLGQLYKEPETLTVTGQAGKLPNTPYTRVLNKRNPSQVLYESAELPDKLLKDGTEGEDSIAGQYAEERAQRSLDMIAGLKGRVSPFNTGLGSLLSYIPGSAARNFQAGVDALKANVGFNELAQMREASKTGGALGNISDTELRLLSSALGSLDTAQSPRHFLEQLNAVEDSIQRWQAARAKYRGAAPRTTTASPPSPTSKRRVVTMDELAKDAAPATVPLAPARPTSHNRRVVTMEEVNPRRTVQMPDLSGATTLSRRTVTVPRGR